MTRDARTGESAGRPTTSWSGSELKERAARPAALRRPAAVTATRCRAALLRRQIYSTRSSNTHTLEDLAGRMGIPRSHMWLTRSGVTRRTVTARRTWRRCMVSRRGRGVNPRGAGRINSKWSGIRSFWMGRGGFSFDFCLVVGERLQMRRQASATSGEAGVQMGLREVTLVKGYRSVVGKRGEEKGASRSCWSVRGTWTGYVCCVSL